MRLIALCRNCNIDLIFVGSASIYFSILVKVNITSGFSGQIHTKPHQMIVSRTNTRRVFVAQRGHSNCPERTSASLLTLRLRAACIGWTTQTDSAFWHPRPCYPPATVPGDTFPSTAPRHPHSTNTPGRTQAARQPAGGPTARPSGVSAG